MLFFCCDKVASCNLYATYFKSTRDKRILGSIYWSLCTVANNLPILYVLVSIYWYIPFSYSICILNYNCFWPNLWDWLKWWGEHGWDWTYMVSTLFKGQLILKCLFGVFKFFQKTNENKSTWGIIVVKSNFFVHFSEELRIPKSSFEINRPLVEPIQDLNVNLGIQIKVQAVFCLHGSLTTQFSK